MSLKQLRNFIFWLFVLIYVILAPLITLNALGFVFDSASGKLIKTGILTLSSNPKAADIFLNHRMFVKKTPAAVAGLFPGSYDVRVERAGYSSWKRRFQVLPEEVTRAEHILLIPTNLAVSHPVRFPVQYIAPSKEGKLLFLVSGSAVSIDVSVYDFKKRKSFPVVKSARTAGSTVIEFELMDLIGDKRALVCLGDGKKEEYFIAYLSEEKPAVALSSILGSGATSIRLDPHDATKILYLRDGSLFLLDMNRPEETKMILNNIKSFELIGGKVYFFNGDHLLMSSDMEGKRAVNLLPDRSLRKLLFDETENYRQVLMSEKGTMFWLQNNGKLVMNRLPYFVDDDVTMAKLVYDAKLIGGLERLIYWKAGELWLLEFNIAEKRDTFFEEGPRKTLVWSNSRPIMDAQMILDNHYAVVTTDEAIWLVEVASPDGAQQWLIQKHNMGRLVSSYVDESTGKLFWVDRNKNGQDVLQEIKLLESSGPPFSFRFKEPYSSPLRTVLQKSG